MNNGHQIILDYPDLIPILEQLRKQDKRIVLTQGSWDMLHVGHARYLEEAKKYGDVLIVGTDSDEKIRKRKGPGRPVVPQEERLEMLTYIRSVDYVVLKPEIAPKYSLIKLVKPDTLIVIKENYDEQQISEVAEFCGEVKVLPRMATTSTSAKLRSVQIGQTKKIESKLLTAIDQVLAEYRD
jgi:D-beta-D-heptose 7-phosphate kinase/D-beta-D-heptose 1-phosphate adenosyltransferase